MVDVVVNHFGWEGSSSDVDYSTYNPFNDPSHFHNFCQISNDDYGNNQTAVEVVSPSVQATQRNSLILHSAGWVTPTSN